MKHRVGFIGFGGMGGGYHFQVARDRQDAHPDYAPVAVYDVRESIRNVAVENGLKAYDNLEEFLASDEFDIVVVATPNNFHCEMTCKALEAGKHVICEKPVAMSIDEFDLMVATAKKCGKYFFVHQNRRFDCDFLIAKHAYETGRLGNMKRIEATFTGGYMDGWRTLASHGGGILYDWGVHLIDQIIFLMKDDKAVSVYANLDCIKLTDCDDYAEVYINFESGATARVVVCGETLVPMYRWNLRGDLGQLWIEEGYNKSGTLRAGDKKVVEHGTIDAYDENGCYKTEKTITVLDGLKRVEYPDDGFEVKQDWVELYKSMFDTIENGAPMLVEYDQVRTVLRIIDAARESSATKTVIKL
ncbi:MAG: Gfo/Idh/MocA family oxidoreductase [Clostridiales bacterium]|nr:Gfo/Idh/MocA family oxidoreductase [Clostridiales bacterium]